MEFTPARIVLHADDLGMNRAVTDGILHGFRHGLLTSTSLLANAPDAARALEQWKRLAGDHQAGDLPSMSVRRRLDDPARPFDLGVHLNLTQGRPFSGARYPGELLDAAGRFPGVFPLFARLRSSSGRFRAAVQAELEQQVQFLCDHGLRPTHLNGHQYVEMIPQIAPMIPALRERFSIKTVRVAFEPSLFRSTALGGLRLWRWPMGRVKRFFAVRFRARMDALGIAHPDAFYGTVCAGGVDLRVMRLFLHGGRQFPLVEIGLHPAERAAEPVAEEWADGWSDPLARLRPNELRLLVSADLPALFEAEHLRLGRLEP